MGFFDSLVANPGGSGIYGNSGPQKPDYETPMSIDSEQRRRDMNDFMQKANFMGNLSLKQDRMRQIYGEQHPSVGTPGAPQQDVVFKDNSITPFQGASLDVARARNMTDANRASMQGKLGQERIDLGEQAHQLNVQKNQNIFDTKQADLQRKADEANQRLDLANRTLQQRGNDAAAQLEFHKSKAEADAAKHALDMANKDKQHNDQITELKRMHDAQIKKMQDDQNSETTTDVSEGGNKKVVKKKTGTNNDDSDKNDDNDPLGIR